MLLTTFLLKFLFVITIFCAAWITTYVIFTALMFMYNFSNGNTEIKMTVNPMNWDVGYRIAMVLFFSIITFPIMMVAIRI